MSLSPTLPDVPEVTPEELVLEVESGSPVQVLDVRAPARLLGGRIELVPDADFHNVPNSRLFALGDPGAAGLDKRRPVAVVCAVGMSSRATTEFLRHHGYDARSVAGGMARWASVLIGRDVAGGDDLDALVQFDRPAKGSLSYLLASDGEAFVVDAPRAAEPILARAEELGARIVGVADTHVHADYVSGGPRLAKALGVPYHLHPGDATHPFDGRPGRLAFSPTEDGATLRVGRASVTVFHGPGHTLGSASYLVDGCALTGDFVFVASVGRPDLAGRTEEWTGDLWRSLERARSEWSDSVRVYPGHYAAETERGESRTVGRTFGEIRGTNEPLGIADEASFRAWVEARVRTAPEAYRRIKAINVGLEVVTDEEANFLEVGKNECACG